MSRAAAFVVLALVAMARGAPGAAPVQSRVEAVPDVITLASVRAIDRWVTMVRAHTPGKNDAAVQMVSELTFDKRRELNAGMSFFLAVLRGNPVTTKMDAPETGSSALAKKQLAAMAGETRQILGADAFLKRAAVLHTDVAFKRKIDNQDLSEPQIPETLGLPPSPLLSQRRLYINKDGEILGNRVAEWNWGFARSLLDLLSVPAADDPFVATWYHATAAFMFQRKLTGEAVPHLHRAAIVLPDDARVLFDRASNAEILGLPRTQVLFSDQDGAVRRLGIPTADETNDEAERLFRRALRADPSFVEARVRLARLLSLKKRHQEAASELAIALAANPTGSVLFYAHLFAGRAAQGQGKIAAAAEHYKAADLSFPGAQSARLARSQAALLGSDVPAALESIQRLDKSSTARDPWWWYHLAAGRDADALVSEMWSQVPK